MVSPLIHIPGPVSLAAPALAQDGATLRYDASNSSVDGAGDVTLRSSQTYSSDGSNFNRSWWFAARINDVMGKAPTITLEQLNHFQQVKAALHNAWWAYEADTDDWNLFDNETYNSETLTVSNDAPFTRGTVYVAHYPIFSYSRVQRLVGDWMQNSHVSDLSDGTDGVIATAPSVTDPVDGRSIPSLDAFGFKITEGTGDKNQCALTCGVHANESIAYWSFEALIEWLLGDSAEAQALRQGFEFYVWPTLAPSALWAGYFRSTPHDDPYHTMNREWSTKDIEPYRIHRTSFGNNFATLDASIDFHTFNNNTGQASGKSFIYAPDDSAHTAYLSALQNYDADATKTASSDELTSEYLRDTYGSASSVCITSETSPERSKGIAYWQSWGEALGKALYDRYQAGAFTYGP